MNDADLVRAARDGSGDAYAMLVRRYRDAVYGVAYHYLRNADDAQDAAQEALVRAYMGLAQLRELDRFGPWLKRIAVNVCRMRLRARRETTGYDDLPEPVASNGDAEQRLIVREALASLPEAHRLTLTLHYLHCYSLAEIAAFLGVPETTVRSRLRNARARLRKELWTMAEATLPPPSLPDSFAQKVMQMIGGAGVVATAFSLDGRLLASASMDRYVRLWDASTGELAREPIECGTPPRGVMFTPDGRLLVIVGVLGIWLLDVETAKVRRALIDGGTPGSVSISPDGRWIANTSSTMGDDYCITSSRVVVREIAARMIPRELCRMEWERPDGTFPTDAGPLGMHYAVAFSPDGRLLATGNSVAEGDLWIGGQIRLWDAGTWEAVWVIDTAPFAVKAVAFSPDGRTIAAGCTRELRFDGHREYRAEVRLYEVATGEQTGALTQTKPSVIQEIAYSSTGRLLATRRWQDEEAEAQLWEVASGKLLASFPGPPTQSPLAFSPDGRRIATGTPDNELGVWEIG